MSKKTFGEIIEDHLINDDDNNFFGWLLLAGNLFVFVYG